MNLDAGAAAPLAHALVQQIAQARGIRVLSIKGPVAAFHDLRPPRVSADADLLIDPPRFDELVAALIEREWYERDMTDAPHLPAMHSTTLIRAGWPCDLDLHSYFPGFLLQPGIAFDALWRDRAEMEIGGRATQVTGLSGSLLVGALHALRRVDARNLRELDLLRAVLARVDEPAALKLVALAVGTGSIEPMRGLFVEAGLAVPPEPPAESFELTMWRLRLSDGTRTTAWVLKLTTARWREKPRLLFRALIPEENGFRAEYYWVGPGRLALYQARAGRIGRGLRRFPRAAWNVFTARRAGIGVRTPRTEIPPNPNPT